MTLPSVWLQAGLGAYAAATLAALAAITRGRGAAVAARLALSCAVLLHTVPLAVGAASTGRFPVIGVAEFTVVLAACVALLGLALDALRGAFIFSAAAASVSLVLSAAAAVFQGPPPVLQQPDPGTFWPGLHVLLLLISYALFAIAFLAGLLYLLAHRTLKAHRNSALLERLPSLETTRRVNRRAVLGGFVLLTTGILVGYLHARNVLVGSAWRLDPKVLLATGTWLCYLVVLMLDALPRTRGRISVGASVVSFTAVVLSLWSSVIWSHFHRYP